MRKNKQQLFLKKAVIISIGLAALILSNLAFAKPQLKITTEENVISVHKADNLLMRYCYNNVPFKPYVQQLCSPGGVNVLRDAPSDHLHHHGLMFAVAVDGVNFWEEHIQPIGQQKHILFSDAASDEDNDLPQAGFIELIDWENSQSKQLLLKEQRTIRVSQPKNLGCTFLTWQSKLDVPSEKKSVKLTGQRYFGLGMRFVESMDKDGRFYNADGKTEVNSTNNAQSRWCAYTGKSNGKVVTAAMFSDSSNEVCKFYWFTMDKPFVYLALTMNLHNEPIELTCDESLKLNYAVALWDGEIDKSRIDKAYKWWTSQLKKKLCKTIQPKLK